MNKSAPEVADGDGRLRAMAVRFGDTVSVICRQLTGAALIVIVVICTVNVVGRYVFAHAFSWAEEAMVFCMIFIIFFGAASVTWNGQHLSLDMVLRRMSVPVQKLVVRITTVASVALLLLLAYHSNDVVSRLYRFGQRTEALEIPMWIPQSFVPAGLMLIALMLLLRLFTHSPLPPEIDYTAEDEHL